MTSLDALGLEQGTDKASNHHDFLRFYERRLGHLRDAAFTLIEVGVYQGGSVRTWEKYLPNARIVGLDINPECRRFQTDRVAIRIGDASNPGFLFDVVAEFGKPLVFVDDGSHRWDHQIATLQVMFPILRPGGIYVLEDIDTSFEGWTRAAPFAGLSPISAFDYIVRLARPVVAADRLGDEPPHDLFILDNHAWVGSVELARRTAILAKKLQPAEGPD